jgi:hypothetical protein
MIYHWFVATGTGLGLFVLFLVLACVFIWAILPPRTGIDPIVSATRALFSVWSLLLRKVRQTD